VHEFAEPGDRLLDVGSGEGYGSVIVGGWVAEYRGLDVSADAVAHARERYAGDDRTGFDQLAGPRFPHDDASFDLVTSFQVIEHVEDVPRYLAEIRRVSRPGARVLITTPNRTLRLADGERPWNRYHLREYSPLELGALLRGVFTEVDIFAVRGSEAMEELEHARVARARRFARVDRLGLRYALPETLDARIRRRLRRQQRPGAVRGAEFSLSDVRRTRDDLGLALDLLAVSRP
jgi:SAM-dependent methyltransferase